MVGRILELLRERGITQKQLADAVNVSTGNISDWKAGKARPSMEVLSRIADFFDVSVDYLIGRTDVRNVSDVIELYNVGLFRWINDRAFKPEESAALKEHLAEMLLRYKTVLNKLANSMYSETRRVLIDSAASCEDLSMSTCEAIRPYLRDLISWIASLPYEFNKRFPAENSDNMELMRNLFSMVGLVSDGSSGESVLSEDERDLLEIWKMLDKDGKRILIGEASAQKQRIQAEKGNAEENAG